MLLRTFYRFFVRYPIETQKGVDEVKAGHISGRQFVAALAAATIALACSKDSVGPDNGFSLKLLVRDAGGKSVAGLRVSAFNDLAVSPGPSKRLRDRSSRPQSVTTIVFQSPVSYRGSLTLLTMKGATVADLFDNALRPAGVYSVNWATDAGLLCGVYWCRLVATDSSRGLVLFHDSVLVSFHHTDPSMSVIGWTNGSGVFETRNEALFPNLFQLPPIPMTDATGPTVIGSFAYSDSVTITLEDTASQLTMSKRGVIKQGQNSIDVAWSPTLTRGFRGEATQNGGRNVRGLSTIDTVVVIVPTTWKLYQNYPNPFN